MPPTDPGLDERVCRKLGWEPSTHIVQGAIFQQWPPVSTSWEWAGKALEEMRQRRDMDISLENMPMSMQPEPWYCNLTIKTTTSRYADTGPLAIARAIDAALPEVEG